MSIISELEATELKLECLRLVKGTDLVWWSCLKCDGTRYKVKPNFSSPTAESYEVALGIVEGKPVFKGDKIFENGKLITATATLAYPFIHYSWKAPKPRPNTVLVELTVEDAIALVSQKLVEVDHVTRVNEAVNRALINAGVNNYAIW